MIRHIRFQLLVDADESAPVRRDPCPSQVEILCVRSATGGDQHTIEFERYAGRQPHGHATFDKLQIVNLRIEMASNLALLEDFQKLRAEIGVAQSD